MFVESRDADDHDEGCGGTGGQRIYDQKPAVGFLGDGLRMTREAGYERRLGGIGKNKDPFFKGPALPAPSK